MRRERFDGGTLDWTLDVAAGREPALRLEWAITADDELYVADRLWDYARDGARIAEPYGVYRFVHDRTLRLLFGAAPRPGGISLQVTYVPRYSRVPAGETRRHALRLALPVDEYSSLARDVGSPTELAQVDRVTLLVDHRLRRTMASDPRPPWGEDPAAAGYIVHDPARVVSTQATAPFAVKRRTGYIARVALAGEPPPGPYPH